jgi:hypothetical protein
MSKEPGTTIIIGETKVVGENVAQRHFVCPGPPVNCSDLTRGRRKEGGDQRAGGRPSFSFLLLSVGPAVYRLAHCSISNLIVLNPVLVPPFISRGASRQKAQETSISEKRKYGRETAGQI